MVATAQELASKISSLSPFPEVALLIEEVLADENASAEDIGAVLEKDPALCATLLKVANSALYSRVTSIDSVAQAVTLMGQTEIRNLTIALCASDACKEVTNPLWEMEDYWRHSLYCGVAAKELGKALKLPKADTLFTAGLLHDIGQLAMFSEEPELSQKALQLSLDQEDGRYSHFAEKEVFGFDHTEVGYELARQWQFPEVLQDCIRLHHTETLEGEHCDLALVIRIANSLAVLAELNSDDFSDAPEIDQGALEHFSLKQEDLISLCEPVRQATAQLLHFFNQAA